MRGRKHFQQKIQTERKIARRMMYHNMGFLIDFTVWSRAQKIYILLFSATKWSRLAQKFKQETLGFDLSC